MPRANHFVLAGDPQETAVSCPKRCAPNRSAPSTTSSSPGDMPLNDWPANKVERRDVASLVPYVRTSSRIVSTGLASPSPLLLCQSRAGTPGTENCHHFRCADRAARPLVLFAARRRRELSLNRADPGSCQITPAPHFSSRLTPNRNHRWGNGCGRLDRSRHRHKSGATSDPASDAPDVHRPYTPTNGIWPQRFAHSSILP